MRKNKKEIWSERAALLGISAACLAGVALIALLVYGLIEQWDEVKSWITGIVCISSLVYLIVWYSSKHNK